jgi:hypothetical protein
LWMPLKEIWGPLQFLNYLPSQLINNEHTWWRAFEKIYRVHLVIHGHIRFLPCVLQCITLSQDKELCVFNRIGIT